jgi:hypothetical protein
VTIAAAVIVLAAVALAAMYAWTVDKLAQGDEDKLS